MADDVPVGGRAELGAFCVVAKVAVETASGQGGLQLHRGVKHFTAGTKVWVLSPQWGDGGEKLIVVGHHRGAHGRGLVRMVVPRRHLTGFQARGVYSPAVMRALTRPLAEFGHDDAPRLWSTREEAEQIAATWRDRPLRAHADDWSFTALVTDPPPLELARKGRTYFLAHFNARRAIYSPWPPPAEPPGSG